MPDDRYANHTPGLTSPARHCFAITPHNSNELAEVTRSIYVGSTGDVVLRAVGSAADVTFVAVPAGAFLDVRASHIRATGTTAASLVGLV